MTNETFKTCSFCHVKWETRDAFLGDSQLRLIGYQQHYEEQRLGFFLFIHSLCQTTLSFDPKHLMDLNPMQVFRAEYHDSHHAPFYCLRTKKTGCWTPCECAAIYEYQSLIKSYKQK